MGQKKVDNFISQVRSILLLIAVVIVAFSILKSKFGAPKPELEYTIINTSEYVRAGEACTAYRIHVDRSTPSKDLQAIVDYLSRNGRDCICVWFYDSPNPDWPFIQYEIENPGEEPVIKKY